MNKFVSSREIHETWVEFIHNSVQFIPEVIIYRTDTQEMDFILNTVTYCVSLIALIFYIYKKHMVIFTSVNYAHSYIHYNNYSAKTTSE